MTNYEGTIDLAQLKSPKRPSRVFFDEKGKGVRILQPYMNELPYTIQSPMPPHPLPSPVPKHTGFETFFKIGDPLVRIEDTTTLPFRSIAYLDLTFMDGSKGFGTGWFAAANTLITAAHCFFDPEARIGVREVVAVPGFSNGFQPFSNHRVARIFVPPEWELSVKAIMPLRI
jgi:V8-like Glu-specific endopeptidase